MEKIVAVFLLLAVSCLPTPRSFSKVGLFVREARADYNSALAVYNSAFEKYRLAYADYISAKNSYLTYKTLNSQTLAIEKTKIFLETRDDLLISYYALLKEKLNLTLGIFDYDKKIKNSIIDARLFFLANHKSTIQSVSSLPDLVQKSSEIDSIQKDLQDETYQIIGLILIGKVKDQSDKLALSINTVSSFTNEIKSTGKDVAKLERWLLETNYKHDLAENKLKDGRVLFDNLKEDYDNEPQKNFLEAKTLIIEGSQYLKESVFNAKEAVKEILTGPY